MSKAPAIFALLILGFVMYGASRGSNPKEENNPMEIERHYGIVVGVGGINTKTLNLPDWELSYVEYPPGQMPKYRDAMMKARLSIVRVTDSRIYFEQK